MPTKPSERTLETELFGRNVSFDYSETWVGHSMLALRLVMAWVFLQAGLEKLLNPEWSAEGYISPETQFGVTEANPLAGTFAELSANAALIDPLVVWSQVLIGVALLIGVLVRLAVFFGAVQLFMFWLASLQGGLLAGLPVEHGWVVNSDIVYILLLFGIGAWGAGRVLGIDAMLEETAIVRNNPWLRYLLG